MLNPPPLTFFVRVLRCVNGKEYFSAILRAEWAGYTPAVFKVPLKKKKLHLFHGSVVVCMVALCFGVAFIRKGKKLKAPSYSEPNWSNECMWEYCHLLTSKQQQARNKSQYKRHWCLFTEPSFTYSNSYSGNECSTWKQRSLSSRDGRALFPMKADDWGSHKSYRREERGRWHG